MVGTTILTPYGIVFYSAVEDLIIGKTRCFSLVGTKRLEISKAQHSPFFQHRPPVKKLLFRRATDPTYFFFITNQIGSRKRSLAMQNSFKVLKGCSNNKQLFTKQQQQEYRLRKSCITCPVSSLSFYYSLLQDLI